MPMYDYFCPANERTVQVMHPMAEDIHNWGEVCARAKIALDATPADAPVSRVLLGAKTMHRRNMGSDSSGDSVFGAMTTVRAYHNTKNFD